MKFSHLKLSIHILFSSLILTGCNSGTTPEAQSTNFLQKTNSIVNLTATNGSISCYGDQKKHTTQNIISGKPNGIFFELDDSKFDEVAKICANIVPVNILKGAQISYKGQDYIISNTNNIYKWLQDNPYLAQQNISTLLPSMLNGQKDNGKQFFTDLPRVNGEISFNSLPGASYSELFSEIKPQYGIMDANTILEEKLIALSEQQNTVISEKNAAALADFITRYLNQSGLQSFDLFTANNSLYIGTIIPMSNDLKTRIQITDIAPNSVKFNLLLHTRYKAYTDPLSPYEIIEFNNTVILQYRIPFEIDTTNYKLGLAEQVLKISVPKYGYSLYEVQASDQIAKNFVTYYKNSWLKKPKDDVNNNDLWSLKEL